MIPYEMKDRYTIADLAEIVALLRSKDGCPWDKVQTHASIRTDLIEETYEVIEAIDQSDPVLLQEELGDLLLQVVFHAQIETEQQHFTLEDVCTDICKKMIIRHPHVFSTVKSDTTEEVLKNWDEIKEETKHQTTRTQTLIALRCAGIGAAIVEVQVCCTVNIYHQRCYCPRIHRHVNHHAVNAVLAGQHAVKLLCRKVQGCTSCHQIFLCYQIMCLGCSFFLFHCIKNPFCFSN